MGSKRTESAGNGQEMGMRWAGGYEREEANKNDEPRHAS
jgi:hypothetical protein